MNVIRHAAHAIRLTTGVAGDGREIRMEFGARGRFMIKMAST